MDASNPLTRPGCMLASGIAALIAATCVALALLPLPAAQADPVNWPNDVGYSWGNGYPSNITNKVQVADVTFYYPDNWSVASASGSSATVSIRSATTGEQVGTLTFKTESVYGTAYQDLVPQEVFSYKCAQAYVSEADFTARAWSPERADRAGLPMAKASYSSISNKGLSVGNLYMALTPDGRYYEMLARIDAEEIRDVEEYVGVVWDAATWYAVSTSASTPSEATGTPGGAPSAAPFDEQAYQAQVLSNAQVAYANSPWYDPLWEVVDYECGFDYSVDPNKPAVTYEVYYFRTPDGWIGSSTDIVYRSTNYGTGEGASYFDHWCFQCYDSEGEGYLRTSGYVYGLGYATDLAFYPGYSDCWYVASTGEAVYTDWEGDWVIWSDVSGEPAWTPHFFD